MNLTAREREIVDLLRAEPLLDAAAIAERIGSTRAAVSVHLSQPHPQGRGAGPWLHRARRGRLGARRRWCRARHQGAHRGRAGARHEQPRHGVGDGRGSGPQHRREPRPARPPDGARRRGGRRPGRRHRPASAPPPPASSAATSCVSPHPTGTYAAVLDDGGDLHIAVADMRATDELTVADLAVVPTLLAGADALVVDANLDATVIRWLLSAAQEAGVRCGVRAGERGQGDRGRAGVRRLGPRAHGHPERRRAGRARRPPRRRHRRGRPGRGRRSCTPAASSTSGCVAAPAAACCRWPGRRCRAGGCRVARRARRRTRGRGRRRHRAPATR